AISTSVVAVLINCSFDKIAVTCAWEIQPFATAHVASEEPAAVMSVRQALLICSCDGFISPHPLLARGGSYHVPRETRRSARSWLQPPPPRIPDAPARAAMPLSPIAARTVERRAHGGQKWCRSGRNAGSAVQTRARSSRRPPLERVEGKGRERDQQHQPGDDPPQHVAPPAALPAALPPELL